MPSKTMNNNPNSRTIMYNNSKMQQKANDLKSNRKIPNSVQEKIIARQVAKHELFMQRKQKECMKQGYIKYDSFTKLEHFCMN